MEHIGTPQEVLEDVRLKEQRLREFMQRAGLQAVVIHRQDHFAWLTAGGDPRVVTTSETGFAYAVITASEKWLVAHSIDARRFVEEQVPGQGFELISLEWHEGGLLERVLELVGGMRVGADAPLPGARPIEAQLARLHYPLTGLDLRRIRWVAGTSHRLLSQIAREIQPGESELAIAARIQEAYTRAGMTVDVLIVGADERISRYRHPLPTGKALEKYALLHPAARRWGLHANLTRLVHFGEPPAAIRRAIDGVLTVEGRVLRALEPGLPFAEILARQKRWYAELGFPDEWRHHFQGGITGYVLADPTLCLDPQARIEAGQAFDYFITITGAKAENLAVLTGEGLQLLSAGGDWPMRAIPTEGGDIAVPDVLVR